jgi:hypothetical protein
MLTLASRLTARGIVGVTTIPRTTTDSARYSHNGLRARKSHSSAANTGSGHVTNTASARNKRIASSRFLALVLIGLLRLPGVEASLTWDTWLPERLIGRMFNAQLTGLRVDLLLCHYL